MEDQIQSYKAFLNDSNMVEEDQIATKRRRLRKLDENVDDEQVRFIPFLFNFVQKPELIANVLHTEDEGSPAKKLFRRRLKKKDFMEEQDSDKHD